MLKPCVKPVESLWKAFGQAHEFCTDSTAAWFWRFPDNDFYPASGTAFAQNRVSFAQAVLAKFNLLSNFLYPVSTMSMNTTNLIKE